MVKYLSNRKYFAIFWYMSSYIISGLNRTRNFRKIQPVSISFESTNNSLAELVIILEIIFKIFEKSVKVSRRLLQISIKSHTFLLHFKI